MINIIIFRWWSLHSVQQHRRIHSTSVPAFFNNHHSGETIQFQNSEELWKLGLRSERGEVLWCWSPKWNHLLAWFIYFIWWVLHAKNNKGLFFLKLILYMLIENLKMFIDWSVYTIWFLFIFKDIYMIDVKQMLSIVWF